MDDWYTVAQAASVLEVSVQRVYALLAAGTISGRKIGRVQFVNRRSVQLYKESPSRNKFAGGHLRKLGEPQLPGLLEDESGKSTYDGEEWSGANPPLLSSEARRLYDADRALMASPRGAAIAVRGEV